MSISITIGWWIAPALVTALAWLWVYWAAPSGSQGYSAIGDGIVGAFMMAAAAVLSLAAWLIWALMR